MTRSGLPTDCVRFKSDSDMCASVTSLALPHFSNVLQYSESESKNNLSIIEEIIQLE